MVTASQAQREEEAIRQEAEHDAHRESRLTVPEVAAIFNREKRWVRLLIEKGQLPAERVPWGTRHIFLIDPQTAYTVMRQRLPGRGRRNDLRKAV